MIKRVGSVFWEIPKKGKMNVPAIVVASEKLLEKMQQDETLQQIQNVATLPSIFEKAIVMPDGHEGYGFPIGGVAAFENIVSPGGIGFDINCLSPNTRVLSEDGYWVELKDLRDILVKSYDVDKGHNGPAEFLFLARRPADKAIKLRTSLGFEIEGSKDHPVLTKEGFVEISNLSVGDKVVINPFEGVKYEDGGEVILEKLDEPQMNSYLRKRGLLPFSYSNKYAGIIARILGFAFGDSHLDMKQRPKIIFYGNENELKELKRILNLIGIKSYFYKRSRKIKFRTPWSSYESQSNSVELIVSSRAFAILLYKLGLPAGNKVKEDYEVPSWILNGPKWIKRNFLAGLFGADGSKPIIKKYTPLAINLTQTKLIGKEESLIKFLNQIREMLLEFGVKSKLTKVKSLEGRVIYRIYIEGEVNIVNFLGKVNYEISNKKEEGLWVLGYLKFKRKIVNERKQIRETAKRLYNKGFSLNEIYSKFKDKVNKRFIERSVYSEVSDARIAFDFMPFEEFKEKYCLPGGFILDEIVSIEKRNPDYDYFYDLGVDRIHNFIANGVVVHNCGVRLVRTNLTAEEVRKKLPKLLDVIFENVPSGVGRGGKVKLTKSQLNEVLDYGVKWAVENGFGWEKDLKHIEENGTFVGADSAKVSDRAKSRGMPQLGSLGAGNHFLEVQEVVEVYDEKVAEKFGLFKGQAVIMIHTGSRGLGHQICSDYLEKFKDAFPEIYRELVDRELIYAPLESEIAQDYLAAMKAAANFAWTNRQMIMHWTRESFAKVFKEDAEELGMDLVYDVAHNIAKIEKYKGKTLLVHRKGATRAFGPGNPEIPIDYQSVGQPVLIPGSMGTASYVLVGSKTAEETTFSSTAHGAGRLLSRKAALRHWRGEQIKALLEGKGILIRSASNRVVAEEAPGAYKDVDEVVRVSHEAGIGNLVVKLKPMGVVKG